MKILLLLILAACTQAPTVSVSRIPAQAEYLACHDIQTELLIPQIDISGLKKNYENVKEVVFKNNCASCHFGSDSYLPHLDDYNSLMTVVDLNDPLKSKLWLTLREGKMPPSYNLDSREPEAMAFLKAWLKEGAPL
jgi:hypothetical protein